MTFEWLITQRGCILQKNFDTSVDTGVDTSVDTMVLGGNALTLDALDTQINYRKLTLF